MKFISLVTDGNETIITAEGLLQVQRMSYLTSVHYQGCRFSVGNGKNERKSMKK